MDVILIGEVASYQALVKLAWLAVVLGAFWWAEGHYESALARPAGRARGRRTNLLLLGIVMALNFFAAIATACLVAACERAGFGLFHVVDCPEWVELAGSVAVLDLVALYLAHVLLHRVPALWRVHVVHHADLHVDVTTGTRHHPLDFLVREGFALAVVCLLGVPLWAYLVYRALAVAFTYFTHANIRLPAKLERALSYVVVTPRMHRVHHHRELPWTDANFGNLFSVWDRLFGTYARVDESGLVYGVDCVVGVDADELAAQLRLPWSDWGAPVADRPRHAGAPVARTYSRAPHSTRAYP